MLKPKHLDALTSGSDGEMEAAQYVSAISARFFSDSNNNDDALTFEWPRLACAHHLISLSALQCFHLQSEPSITASELPHPIPPVFQHLTR